MNLEEPSESKFKLKKGSFSKVFDSAAAAAEDENAVFDFSSQTPYTHRAEEDVHSDDDVVTSVAEPTEAEAPVESDVSRPVEDNDESDELFDIEKVFEDATREAEAAEVASEPEVETESVATVEPAVEEVPTEPVGYVPTVISSTSARREDKSAAPMAPIVPGVSPQPQTQEPVSTGSRIANLAIPSEEDQLTMAEKIIRVVDVFRKLTSDEKTVVVQLLTNGQKQEASDAFVAVKALNAPRTLTDTMTALREAWEADPVERPFYVMGLEKKNLHYLGDAVSMFTSTEYSKQVSTLEYSRTIVGGIQEITESHIEYVRAAEQLLLAAKEIDNS